LERLSDVIIPATVDLGSGENGENYPIRISLVPRQFLWPHPSRQRIMLNRFLSICILANLVTISKRSTDNHLRIGLSIDCIRVLSRMVGDWFWWFLLPAFRTLEVARELALQRLTGECRIFTSFECGVKSKNNLHTQGQRFERFVVLPSGLKPISSLKVLYFETLGIFLISVRISLKILALTDLPHLSVRIS